MAVGISSEDEALEPEEARLRELAVAAAKGQATDAEREELALYLDRDATALARVEAIAEREKLGGAWLERVKADDAIQTVEKTRLTRVERGIGLGLAAVGFAGLFVFPPVGAPILGLGTLILAWSVLRVRLATFQSDPYKDIER